MLKVWEIDHNRQMTFFSDFRSRASRAMMANKFESNSRQIGEFHE